MADDGDRTKHWPAIERKHGQPIEHWIALVRAVPDARYAPQMAVLQDEHGFSRTHANAVVMYARGSTSAKRFDTVDGYLDGFDPAAQRTVRTVLGAIERAHPAAETVIATVAKARLARFAMPAGSQIHETILSDPAYAPLWQALDRAKALDRKSTRLNSIHRT